MNTHTHRKRKGGRWSPYYPRHITHNAVRIYTVGPRWPQWVSDVVYVARRPGPLNPGKRAITASANRVAENLWADPLSNPSKPLSSLAGKLPGAGKRVLVPYDISTRLAFTSPSSLSPLRLRWLMQIARLDNSIAEKGLDSGKRRKFDFVGGGADCRWFVLRKIQGKLGNFC